MRGVDVLLCPDGHIPLGWTGKSVVVVHDLATYEHPEWFPGVRSRWSAEWLYPRSLKRADAIVAVSEATRQQIARVFPGLEKKTRVVYHGVSVPVQETHLALGARESETIVFIGTLEPRKNLITAMRAFGVFLHAHPDRAATARFVLAGQKGWGAEPILAAMDEINAAWRSRAGANVIVWNGPVTEQEKWSLLRNAAALLFPSLWEGFGLPVLEAMAVGTPVITSDRGALAEVAGDAAMYVDPDDIGQIALAIAQAVLMPEAMQELREAGRVRASTFTWERAAEETVRVVDDAMRVS